MTLEFAQPIALGQFNSWLGDLRRNRDEIIALARKADEYGSSVLALPFGAITGTPLRDLSSDPRLQSLALQTLHEISQTLQGLGLAHLTVIGAGCFAQGDQAFNISQGRVNYYPINTGFALVPIQQGKTAAATAAQSIEEVEAFTQRSDFSGSAHADYLLILGAVPYEQDIQRRLEGSIIELSQFVRKPVCYVNLVGGQDDLVYYGGSSVVTDHGKFLLRSPIFREHLTTSYNTDPDFLQAAPETTSAQTYRAITMGLRDYVQKNAFKSVVLGLSGGIDSALLAAVAADAVGGENVTCLAMPSPYSSQHSLDDAKDLARRIGAEYRVVPINPAMEAFTNMLPMPGLAEENLQARIRGVLLMAVSNTEGKVVLAPGNKSEIAVGYSTIYGDAVGGFAPLKDVYKSEVWELARWRNSFALDRDELPPIPESSITKPPSAELRYDQVDQDSLPEYRVLDALLRDHLEGYKGRQELITEGFDTETVDRVLKLLAISEWKRGQYPPGPKVTSRAFNTDRKVPITNRWHDREEDNV